MRVFEVSIWGVSYGMYSTKALAHAAGKRVGLADDCEFYQIDTWELNKDNGRISTEDGASGFKPD